MNSKVKHIFYLLGQHSKNNYLVGGHVRDGFLGIKSKDYDIVTDIPMDISKPLFEENGFKVNECGEAFLVLVVSKDGEQFEIANFRKEFLYIDGRRPSSVEIGTIEEDAARRDLHINALYENPVTGEILDPTGKGLSDIKNKIISFVGNPEDRIREDYLRLWRAIRFNNNLKKLGFSYDKKTEKAIRRMFNESYINSNPERVREELEKMT